MASKKGPDPLDHGHINFTIHPKNYKSPLCRAWKKQNNAHLEGATPRAIPSHAHQLKRQLDDVYRSSRGREGVPRKMLKHFSESFDDLYEELLPSTAGDTIAAAAVHERGEAQPDKKRSRRIDAFRAELPRPFNERHDVDPTLAIFVPIDDGGAMAVLRDLPADRILEKLREAVHETHWWFMEDGFVAWIIAVRQLPGGDVEVFADTAEHRDLLQKHSAWEVVFLERLKQESCRYGVSPLGLRPSVIPKHHDGRALIQQFFDWNQPRMLYLRRIEDIISIETRPTNYGRPIVVVNFSTPWIANEFINRGIQWGATEYQGRRYVREWSLFQCEECWSFGHTSVSCTQGTRCRKCSFRHIDNQCPSNERQCVNCGGSHTATNKDCSQMENEARLRRELPSCSKKYWPIEKKAKLSHRNQKASSPEPKPKPVGESRAEQDENREGSVVIADKSDDQDQHTAHNNNEIPSAGVTDSGEDNIATDRMLEQEQHISHINTDVPLTDAAKLDIATIENIDGSLEQDQPTIHIKVNLPSPVHAAEPVNHDVRTIEQPNEAPEQDKHAEHIGIEISSADAAMHDVATMEYFDRSLEQNQNTAQTITELRSADIAEAGKHEVATTENVAGAPEQEHPGTIPVAKEPEDVPASRSRVQNLRYDTERKAAEAIIAGSGDEGDDDEATPPLKDGEATVTRIEADDRFKREMVEPMEPLPIKPSQAISTTTQTREKSTTEQKISDIMKLFQAGCIPNPAPINDKRKETEKEITARKLRELEAEIASCRGAILDKQGLAREVRQTERMEDKDIFEERAAEAEATTGAKEKENIYTPPAVQISNAYKQESTANKQDLESKGRQDRRRQNILKKKAAAKEKKESTVLPAMKKNDAYMQEPIADKQGPAKKGRQNSRRQYLLMREAAKAEATAGANEEGTGIPAKEGNDAEIAVFDTLPTGYGKPHASESTNPDDLQAHINPSNEPKMIEPMSPKSGTLPQNYMQNTSTLLQNSRIDEMTTVQQKAPEIHTPYAPMALLVLPPLIRRFQARVGKD
ncbi:MAG: hypothetical protein Q9226_002349 [Calogaya cf. arnoldii]